VGVLWDDCDRESQVRVVSCFLMVGLEGGMGLCTVLYCASTIGHLQKGIGREEPF
jgi:hypothetical protein